MRTPSSPASRAGDWQAAADVAITPLPQSPRRRSGRIGRGLPKGHAQRQQPLVGGSDAPTPKWLTVITVCVTHPLRRRAVLPRIRGRPALWCGCPRCRRRPCSPVSPRRWVSRSRSFFGFEGEASLQSHEFLRIQILWIASVDSRETLASFRRSWGWHGPVTDTDEHEGQNSPPCNIPEDSYAPAVPSPFGWGTLGGRRSDIRSFGMLADRRAQPAVSDEPQKKYAVLPSPVAETGNSGASSK